MWVLIGQLIAWALAHKAQTATGVALVGEAAVTLQELRDRAQVVAGASDIQALDEAARTAARMLGLDGSHVLWPMDRLGNHIAPKYFHVDLLKGRAWYTAQYYSRKSVMRRRGGYRRGYGAMRSIATAAVNRWRR